MIVHAHYNKYRTPCKYIPVVHSCVDVRGQMGTAHSGVGAMCMMIMINL